MEKSVDGGAQWQKRNVDGESGHRVTSDGD
jgi:hypothetical protein